jgi:uncharacterized protein
MNPITLIALTVLCLSWSAQAASFDCANAQTKVEKMICTDKQLSKLDEDLAVLYATQLKRDSGYEIVRQAQKQWLKVRNNCIDANCLRNIYSTRISSLISRTAHTISSRPSDATSEEVQKPICSALARLWADGAFRRYSIPFEQPNSDELIYKVDINNDGRLDEIRALCGNGTEASCEITAQLKGMEPIDFGLPATIRLLKFRKAIYIANGVTIGRSGVASFSNYMIHKLSKSGIELTCKGKL